MVQTFPRNEWSNKRHTKYISKLVRVYRPVSSYALCKPQITNDKPFVSECLTCIEQKLAYAKKKLCLG
jgi:hypothetical protein